MEDVKLIEVRTEQLLLGLFGAATLEFVEVGVLDFARFRLKRRHFHKQKRAKQPGALRDRKFLPRLGTQSLRMFARKTLLRE
jgi:hypothetical protein